MIYVVAGVVAAILIFVIVSYNGLVKGMNAVEEAFATMDVYLKKRWDLMPNLVRVVKAYAKHEAEVLEKIVTVRNAAYSALSEKEKIDVNTELGAGMTNLWAVAENYPQLKSSDNFIHLNEELAELEDEIANSRKYYNAVVKNYNNRIEMFPGNLVAKVFGYKEMPMFEVADDERETVKAEV